MIRHIDIPTPYIQTMPAHCRFANTQRTVYLFDSDTLKYVFILIFWSPSWYVILMFWHPTSRRSLCIVASHNRSARYSYLILTPYSMWIHGYSDTLHDTSYWYSDTLHTGNARALSLRKDAAHFLILTPYSKCLYWYSDTLHDTSYWYPDTLHTGNARALSLRKDAGHCISTWFWHPKVCEYTDILKP